ncbi:unnamed protein product [Pleuronectes platessa]|uniref:Uncharacterized protein n=1 Tax=Pleuronectes platessa TaxID=8262 RepID=A0A9N7UCL9_PLEPL|nr:unnamed protein product [Pleuronectes platessa]
MSPASVCIDQQLVSGANTLQPPRVDESVFCAGQIALVPCTLQLMKAGTRGQAHLSFSHVEKVLEAVISSLTLAHVVQAHCYTTRRQDIPVVRAVWERMLTAAEEEQSRPNPLPPHTVLELRSTLQAAYPPLHPSLLPPPSLHPSLHSAAPAYNPCLHASNGGTSLPWQPFSSHNNLSRHGSRASGKSVRSPPPTCGSVRLVLKTAEWMSTLCHFLKSLPRGKALGQRSLEVDNIAHLLCVHVLMHR